MKNNRHNQPDMDVSVPDTSPGVFYAIISAN